MGQHGYPDWQPPGVVIPQQGTSPTVIEIPTAVRKEPYKTEVFDVTSWGSLALVLTPDEKGHFLICTLRWYTDINKTIQLAERSFVLGPKAEAPEGAMECRVANLGPFVDITLESSAGAAAEWEAKMYIAQDNRTSLLETPMKQPILFPRTSVALKAGEAGVKFPRFYYSGPMIIGAYGSTNKQGSVNLQVWDPKTKNWETILAVTTAANGETVNYVVSVPLGVWRVLFAKETEMTVGCEIMPSTTGAT